MPMNVGGAIAPAMNHTGRVLFRPFALRNWLALGFVSLFAQAGQGGRVNIPSGGSSETDRASEAIGSWIGEHTLLIVAAVLLLIMIKIVFSWLGSVFRFVYLNQITRDPQAIREPFSRFMALGTSFFLWELAFGLALLLTIGILIALPAALIFAALHGGAQTTLIAVLLGLALGLPLVIFAGATVVFGRDFVLPTMYVRNVKVIEAWRIVMPILRANVGQSVLYILLLIVIAIIMGIGGVVVAMAALVVFAIPGGVLALIGYGIYAAGGETWSAPLIAYTAVMGTALLLALAYAASCGMQPFHVFRRSFALIVLGQADPSLATVPEA